MKCKIIFERDPKTLKVTDKIKAVKAPNGKRSLLFDSIKNDIKDDNKALVNYYKVYTNEFKELFGDWDKKNKLDKNGEPKYSEVKDIISPTGVEFDEDLNTKLKKTDKDSDVSLKSKLPDDTIIFKTSKGSKYTFKDGKTSREKVSVTGGTHKFGEVDQTVFMTNDVILKLISDTSSQKLEFDITDNTLSVTQEDFSGYKSTNKYPITNTPAVNLHPLELIFRVDDSNTNQLNNANIINPKGMGMNPNGVSFHPGNAITSIESSKSKLPDETSRIDNTVKEKYFSDGDTQSHTTILQRIIDDEHPLAPLAEKLLSLSSEDMTVELVDKPYIETDEYKSGLKGEKSSKSAATYQEFGEGDTKRRVINIASRAPINTKDLVPVILHEMLHGYTISELNKNTKVARQLSKIHKEALKYRDEFRDDYPLTSLNEFIVAVYTNPYFIQDLQKLPSLGPNKSLWEDLLKYFKAMFEFNLNERTLFDDAFYVSNKVLENYSDSVKERSTIKHKDPSNEFFEKIYNVEITEETVGSEVKKGVDNIFKDTVELSKIGTKEQYSEYLDTIFPDSKVKDVVYHGTSDKNVLNRFIENPIKGLFVGTYELAKEYARGRNKTVFPLLINSKEIDNVSEEVIMQGKKQDGDTLQYSETDYTEYVVFKPEQIHILGSKKDIQGFKDFVSEDKQDVAKSLSKATENIMKSIAKRVDKPLAEVYDNNKIKQVTYKITEDSVIGAIASLTGVNIDPDSIQILPQSEDKTYNIPNKYIKNLDLKKDDFFLSKVIDGEKELQAGKRLKNKEGTKLSKRDSIITQIQTKYDNLIISLSFRNFSNPYLISDLSKNYLEFAANVAENNGEFDNAERLRSASKDQINEMISEVRKTQIADIQTWINYLNSRPDYSTEFKYYVLNSVIKSNVVNVDVDKGKVQLTKRNQSSVNSFESLNARALANVYDKPNTPNKFLYDYAIDIATTIATSIPKEK